MKSDLISNFACLEKNIGTYDIRFISSITLYLGKKIFLEKHSFNFFLRKTIKFYVKPIEIKHFIAI